jgi:hypothetical protein
MFRYRRRRSVLALLVSGAVLVAIPGPVFGAEPDVHDHSAERHVAGTETMPLPPNAKEMARLAALNGETGSVEGAQDITAAVTTHTVTVRASADEEYRSYYGSTGWKNYASSVVETADDYLFSQFGIDMVITNYLTWDSYPDSSRSSCNLWSELANEIPLEGDVVVGFSKNATSGSKGCAGGNHTITLFHGDPDASGEKYAQWTVQRHEFAHLYGAPDRSPSLLNHPTDLMENQYEKPNFLCTTVGYNDWAKVSFNADKYD